MLSRWLASLPVQLSQLGHRNPMLSAQLILSIQAAASRGNKDLLSSLQTHACTLYGEHENAVIIMFGAACEMFFGVGVQMEQSYLRTETP